MKSTNLFLVACTLALLFAPVSSSLGQEVPDAIAYFDLPGKIDHVRKSSVSIEVLKLSDDIKQVDPTLLGSGFLTLIGGNVYAVTNYHVVKGVHSDTRLLVGVNFKEKKAYNVATVSKFDPVKDIAILSLADTIIAKTAIDLSQLHFNQASIGVSMFSDSSEFVEGQSVLLIGFPLGLGSEIASNQPVSRIGMIAQSRRRNGSFLLDGIASHGNSGSPVFNLKNMKLLGMVVGFPSDYITAYDENGQLVARLPYNSGLSLCISSSDILKLIQ